MEEHEALDKAISIIRGKTTNPNTEKMIGILEKENGNEKDDKITDNMLGELGQITYKDYAEKKKERK